MASAAEQLAANINFAAFAKATDLQKRIWFTLIALVVYRIGTFIPIPGIDPTAFANAFQQPAPVDSGCVRRLVTIFPFQQGVKGRSHNIHILPVGLIAVRAHRLALEG